MSANHLDPASSAPQTVEQARIAVLDAVGAYVAAACAATVINRGQADVMWHALRGALDALILAVERRVREEAQQEIAKLTQRSIEVDQEWEAHYRKRAEAAEAEVTRLKAMHRRQISRLMTQRDNAIEEVTRLSSRLAQQEKN